MRFPFEQLMKTTTHIRLCEQSDVQRLISNTKKVFIFIRTRLRCYNSNCELYVFLSIVLNSPKNNLNIQKIITRNSSFFYVCLAIFI